MTPTVRRLVAWMLLFALAWSGAAQALATRAGLAELSGICSVEAPEARDAGSGKQHEDPAGLLVRHLHHCAFCAPAAHAALPTAPASFPVVLAHAASLVVPCVADPLRPVQPGSTCRPRGPPQTA